MSLISQSSTVLAALTLTSALVVHAATASPIHRVQYDVHDGQQAAPRDDQETVANQQTPSELQSRGARHGDRSSANEQPSSGEQQNGEQAAAPPPAPGQPNAFVSEKDGEPQNVVQTEPQSSEQSAVRGEQASPPAERNSEQPGAGSQQDQPPTETRSGDDGGPCNP